MSGHLQKYFHRLRSSSGYRRSYLHRFETTILFNWVNTWTYIPVFLNKDSIGSKNQLFEGELILLITESYEFFSVIEINPISSEGEIPKNH